MTSGQIYAGQPSRAADLKGRIDNLLEGENDPQVLADLLRLMNSYLKQSRIQRQELLSMNNRYNSVPANDSR
ncbi:MAG: hypothetical protein AAFO82_13600, partial [Bacteroidota bacterium]